VDPGVCYNEIRDSKGPARELRVTAEDDRLAQRKLRSAQILTRVRAILPRALETYPLAAAYVYGSVARGTPLPTSDLDIALVTQPRVLSPYERLTLELRIQADIEDAAHADAGSADTRAKAVEQTSLLSIDIRIINDAPLLVRGRILQEGVLVYEGDHQARVNFEVATLGRYLDYAPVARRLQQASLDHVRREGILHG
jgi:uncharacterized protein